jgi:hypothetical protein
LKRFQPVLRNMSKYGQLSLVVSGSVAFAGLERRTAITANRAGLKTTHEGVEVKQP